MTVEWKRFNPNDPSTWPIHVGEEFWVCAVDSSRPDNRQVGTSYFDEKRRDFTIIKRNKSTMYVTHWAEVGTPELPPL